MSIKSIKAFYEKAESDERLKKKLMQLTEEAEKESLEKVMRLAQEQGYEFSIIELMRVRADRVMNVSLGLVGYVSEEEEEGSVVEAGGKSCCHWAHDCMPGFSGKGEAEVVQPE